MGFTTVKETTMKTFSFDQDNQITSIADPASYEADSLEEEDTYEDSFGGL